MYSNCILFQYEEENTNVIIEDKDTTKLNRELDKLNNTFTGTKDKCLPSL
jgi:hypothetical protein